MDAPRVYLAQAIAQARLPPATLQLEIPEAPLGVDHPGRLVYPTYLCNDAHAWLSALAHLVGRSVDVRLYQIETAENDPTVIFATRRIFPTCDADLLTVLRGFTQENADLVENLGERIERAFGLLRMPVTEEMKGFVSD